MYMYTYTYNAILITLIIPLLLLLLIVQPVHEYWTHREKFWRKLGRRTGSAKTTAI